MDDNEIKRDIKSIIAKIARIDPDGISDTDSLRHDLSIDSLQASQIIGMIDEKYGIEIDEVEIFNVDNVQDTLDIIKEYMNK